MSEQKMREALELAILTMQRNVMKDCKHGQTSGLYAAIFKCQEALAAPSGEQVGLTDREMPNLPPVEEGGFGNGPFRYTDRQMLAYGRAAIAAHEAKRNGGAA